MPGLIDSGADNSMFPLAWAKPLGISENDCRQEECSTTGGMTTQFVWEQGLDAEIQALNTTVHLHACFAEGLPIVLLGRHDFFNAIRVSFDQRSLTFTLQQY